MRKQFNLKDWLKDKSQKIETRNGRPAHYIGLDRAGWQVFEIFRTNETSEYKTYHDSYLYSGPGESPYDLFIVTPEEELTEWEKAVGIALTDYQLLPRDKDGIANIHDINEFTKKKAAKLLSLAREQFVKDGYVIEKKAFHDAVENISDKHLAEMSVQYSIHCKVENGTRHAIMNWDTFQKVAQKFIDLGKAEALKDLPRWKKAKEYMELGPDDFVFTLDSDGKCLPYWDTEVEEGQFYITQFDLENLPKEDEK